jgi:hypothetical protein
MNLFTKHWRKLLFYGLILAIICIPLFTYLSPFDLIGFNYVEDASPQIPFESEKWQDKSIVESSNSIRYRMVSDLIQRYQLDGKGRGELVSLLGEPDKSDRFHMFYRLGTIHRLIGKGSVWLKLQLNDGKSVTTYRIVND